MYFQPVLADGTQVRLPWQIRSIFFRLVWPLQDGPLRWMKAVDKLYACVVLIGLAVIAEGCLHFFVSNLSNMVVACEALATCLIHTDTIFRIVSMILKKVTFKSFLQKFYREIYIDETKHPEVSRKVRRSIIPMDMFAYTYLFSIFVYCVNPVVSAVMYHTRLLPHQILMHYDLTDPVVYAGTLAIPIVNDMFIVLVLGGELCLLGNFVGHLRGRYMLLKSQLEAGEALLMSSGSYLSSEKIAKKFRLIVKDGINDAKRFNEFAKLINETYSQRIFSMIAHSGVMLCMIILLTSTLDFSSPRFAAHIGWMVGKLLEIIIFGNLGSKLITTTNDLSSMFYHCNWESIVYRSTNRAQNVLLMRDIHLAILLYNKPMELSGLGFFNVSLETAASLIRVAGSYFTFLRTFQ